MAIEDHKKWLEMVLNGIPYKDATTACFDVKTDNAISSKTSQLKTRYSEELYNGFNTLVKAEAIPAMMNIIELSKTGKQEAVKLKASQYIVEQAGFTIGQTLDINVKDSTPEQIQAKIDQLLTDNPEQLTTLLSLIDKPTLQ